MFRAGVILTVLLCLAAIATPVTKAYQGYRALNSAERLIRADLVHSQPAHLSQTLKDLQHGLQSLHGAYEWSPYLRFVPTIGPRYQNLRYILAAAQNITHALTQMEPAIEGGFRSRRVPGSQNSTTSGKALMDAVIGILPDLSPTLRKSLPYWHHAQRDLEQVNWQLFQGPLGPTRVRDLKTATQFFSQFVSNIPLIVQNSQVLKRVLGIPVPQTYLLLFQNSGELRPTGGFITAYSLVTVHNGHLHSLSSHNIYSLRHQITYRPPAPPILHYVYTQHWHMRDANISPNLPTTAQYINRFYSSIPGLPRLNGMIFVNTWLVDNLLKVTGPLTMPAAYHNLTITWRTANKDMELIAEHSHLPSSTRKAFIGAMMQMLLNRARLARGAEFLQILKALGHGLNRKYLLVWFHNSQSEQLAISHNWAGLITKNVPADYLEIVDMNLGGHKDNFFMHETITINIRKQGSRYIQSDTITWYNPALDNGWLVVPYQSYLRVYVPLGSQLVTITHGNGHIFAYNNHAVNKTVFGRHISLPGRTSHSQPARRGSITITYRLPQGLPLTSLLIQKQPGIRSEQCTITDGSFHRTLTLNQDMRVELSQGQH